LGECARVCVAVIVIQQGCSTAVRHMRHNMKRKSEGQSGGNEKTKAVRFQVVANDRNTETTDNEADVSVHMDELKKAWTAKDKSRNDSHLKMLLKHTKQYRLAFLRDHPSGRIKPVFEEFPCFQDSNYVCCTYKFSVKYVTFSVCSTTLCAVFLEISFACHEFCGV